MSIMPNISTQPRKHTISEPKTDNLIHGIIFAALGLFLASVATCDILSILRWIFLSIGIISFIIGSYKLNQYRNSCIQYKNYTPQWDKSMGIFDQFAKELNDWYADNTPPSICDQDTSYFLKLQNDRLKDKNIHMIQYISPSKSDAIGTHTISSKTKWYTANRSFESVDKHLAFQKNGETIYKHNTEETMYETIIHSPNESELEHLLITCPNCGASCYVSELTGGCRYCNTQFQITDLFPRVTNLFFVKMASTATNSSVMHKIIGTCIGGIFIIMLPFILADHSIALPFGLLFDYAISVLIGGMCGILLTFYVLIASLFANGGRKRIPLFRSLAAKGKIKKTLMCHDPYFSFEKFEGQIISLIRMAVFAKDPASLTAYKGTTLDPRFEDIIEMTHISSFVVKQIREENHILHMTLRTWWINYNDINGKIKKTGDCIDVTISKDVSHTETPGFSITSVNCHNCGGSFDAVRQHTCPYCQTEYHMEQDNWVIEDMKLIR